MPGKLSEEERLLEASERYMRGDMDLETYERETRRYMEEYRAAIRALAESREVLKLLTEFEKAEGIFEDLQRTRTTSDEFQEIRELLARVSELIAKNQSRLNQGDGNGASGPDDNTDTDRSSTTG
jgi:hypothetical protein